MILARLQMLTFKLEGTATDGEPGDTTDGTDAALAGSIVYDTIPTRFTLTFNEGDTLPGPSAIAIDVFTFGYDTEKKEKHQQRNLQA